MLRRIALISSLVLATSTAVVATPAARASHGALDRGQRSWMSPDANPKHAWLYVAGDHDNTVWVYDIGGPATRLIGTITNGVSLPGGIALDAQGDLYVPNENAATVTVYAPGATMPTLTLTGTNVPQCVAVASDGTVYVANRGSSAGISVYPAGQSTPSQNITSSLLPNPNQIVFDPGGTLYISDTQTGISILPPGPSQTVTSLNLQNLPSTPSGVTIDPSNGDVYVSTALQSNNQVSLYPAGQQTPSKIKKVPFGGLDFLAFGQLRGHDSVFVPDAGGNMVWVLKPSLRGAPGMIGTKSGTLATSVAFKPAGIP